MPKFLEEQLKRTAAKKGYSGDRADAYVYGTMNKLGAMRGNKITEKGRRMEAKHASHSKRKDQAEALEGE